MIRIMEPGPLQLGVLASGRGSNFDAICDAIDKGQLQAEIKILISDKNGAPVLQKAANRGIKTLFVNPQDFTGREDYERLLVEKLHEARVNIIALAGYMRLVGPIFLQAYANRILNIHPALLPSFTGLHAQRQAVEYGVKFSGCTVHIVDQGMDSGPIVMQAVVPVYDDDDEESLSERILEQEHNIYWQALQLFAEGRVYIDGRKVRIDTD